MQQFVHKRAYRLLAPLDVLIAVTLAAGALGALPLLSSQKADTVAVYRDNKLVAEYPLSPDRTFSIEGNAGKMQIRIENGRVSVGSSTCQRQICVRSSPVREPHAQIVCAPNHVLIEIRSTRAGEGVDAVSR